MTTPPAPLPPPAGASRAAEDRYLWRSFRHHSRTFTLATRLLPARVRLFVDYLANWFKKCDSRRLQGLSCDDRT